MQFSPAQFPATVVRSRDLGDFVLTETRYRPLAALPEHSHEYGCLVVVLEGTFREQFDGKPRHGAPGMIIARPEGEPHWNRFDERGGRCLNIEIAPRWLTRMREGSGAFGRSATFNGPRASAAARELYAELTQTDIATVLAVETTLIELQADGLGASRGKSARPPRWLLDVRDTLHGRACATLRLHSLAERAGVHPVHLATSFRRHFGATVASYQRRLRIEYACRALARSRAELSDVALAAGFADQSHFGRTFKQLMGLTPAQYRRVIAPSAATADDTASPPPLR